VKFALLIYGDEDDWASLDEAGRVRTYEERAAFGAWLPGNGWDRGGEELALSARAATVRAQGDGFVVADGPFAETREQLGGFYVIDCPSREDAVEAARRPPADVVEVRPIVEED
jgi:hypothetical protein